MVGIKPVLTSLASVYRTFVVVLLLAAAPLLDGLAMAASAKAEDGAERCEALSRADFSRQRDAPFLVNSARIVSADGMPGHCRVEGYSAPEITFDARLPLVGWNGGFVLVGSGGWANRKFGFLCSEPLARGFACIAGDGGHQSNGGLWMQSDPRAKIDWGYRATHATTLVGKALVNSYYGRAPSLSLMIGVSTGGYQGLVEAQRFPWDFDGIVAIGPDIDEADLSMRTTWAANHLADADGTLVFTEQDLAVLHKGALGACDITDGVRDGVIGDPVGCRFDPRTVKCSGVEVRGCLSQRQVAAAIAIYGGPTTSAGVHVSTGGPLPGSELRWLDILEDVKFAENFFRFALADERRDGLSARDFDFDEDYKRLGLAGTFMSSNPDLRKFAAAGGKLLIVQGGNDVTEQSRGAIDYYEMVDRVSGGGVETRRFARLFVVPGMNHSSGGAGAFAIDYLSVIAGWASDGIAPDVLIGAHVPEWENGDASITAGLTAPRPGMTVTFTRPVYPYPLVARYRGEGSTADARSFVPVAPTRSASTARRLR